MVVFRFRPGLYTMNPHFRSSLPQTAYYGELLAENYEALREIHYTSDFQNKYVRALSPKKNNYTAFAKGPADDVNMRDLHGLPEFDESYRITLQSYNFSPVQKALLEKRLMITSTWSTYNLYNDRAFNALCSFIPNWNEVAKSGQLFLNEEENISTAIRYAIGTDASVEDKNSVTVDGETYRESGYNDLMTGAFALRWHENMINDNVITVKKDDKENIIAGLRAQEQLTLNCANLYYLFHENWARETHTAVKKPAQPEFPLDYPAKVPGR